STLGPTARLFLKEIQLQGGNLLLVPAVLVAWGVVWVLTFTAEPVPDLIDKTLRGFPSIVLLFLFPLLIGSTAVAAERQMGLFEWHASLPVSRARQWGVKVLVVISLSLVGGVLGGFAGHLDTFFLSDTFFSPLRESQQLASPRLVSTYLWISVFSAGLGIHASSRAREPFRAVIGGLALMVWTLVPATSPAALQMRGLGLTSFFFPDLPGGAMYVAVAVPTLALLLFAFLSFRPEPWLSENVGGRALRFVVLGGLLLTIGFW
ncbi:MAG: hypothetical protein ACRD1Z_02480, partial [Vicinamibacteria bacterium]